MTIAMFILAVIFIICVLGSLILHAVDDSLMDEGPGIAIIVIGSAAAIALAVLVIIDFGLRMGNGSLH